MITAADAETFARCMAVGGVAVFGVDTVYGLACAADSREAVRRLNAMKERPAGKPGAVLFFDRDTALGSLPEIGPRTRAALERLLPGAVTVLLPNPATRYPLACGAHPEVLGLRVPALEPDRAALAVVRWPVLQSSANLAGGADPSTLAEVPAQLRLDADLLLDVGPLPGTPSTIVDLTAFEADGTWTVVRDGAMDRDSVAAAVS